jgi:hypothetical protein
MLDFERSSLRELHLFSIQPPLVTFSERTLYGYGSQMSTAPERFVRQSIDFAAGATIQTRTGYVA